jgi:glucose-6-phosphate dehydrogenase assembly protein OpcA
MEPMQALQGAPPGEIELSQVERELAALWRAAAPEDPDAEPTVLRACSLNLLVLAGSPDELERARPIAAQTTLAHPSRILLVAPENGSPQASGVGARISTFCHGLGGGGRHVCCEEITLVARGSAASRLREAALPLLVPDLPVHLWLPDPNSHHSTAVERLAGLADEVIWSARPVDELLPAAPNRPRSQAVVDLDWIRLLPWRELAAQFFDSPDRRSLLHDLESVEVVVAGSALPRPAAGWLCVGWLASRLDWQHVAGSASGNECRFTGPGGPVTAQVQFDASSDAVPGELLALRFRLRGSTRLLSLQRQAAPDRRRLWIVVNGERCVDMGIRDEAALLGESLEGAARDPVYEAAWDLAAQLWQNQRA